MFQTQSILSAYSQEDLGNLQKLIPHVYIGIVGVPGAGKDLVATVMTRYLSSKVGVPVRLAIADVLRDIAATITGERFDQYWKHPDKDECVTYRDFDGNLQETKYRRRDFMIDIGKFFENALHPSILGYRIINIAQGILREHLVDVIRALDAEEQVKAESLSFEAHEAGTLEVIDTEQESNGLIDLLRFNERVRTAIQKRTVCFLLPDIRQEYQYEWLAKSSNGVIIRVDRPELKNQKFNPIDQMLLDHPADLVLDHNEVKEALTNPDLGTEIVIRILEAAEAKLLSKNDG